MLTDEIRIPQELVGGTGTWSGYGIEFIEFDNGDVWTQEDVKAKLLAGARTDGNDTIIGFESIDTLSGGKGNDIVKGGNGNDTYVFARGDGQDILDEENNYFYGQTVADRLEINGYLPPRSKNPSNKARLNPQWQRRHYLLNHKI